MTKEVVKLADVTRDVEDEGDREVRDLVTNFLGVDVKFASVAIAAVDCRANIHRAFTVGPHLYTTLGALASLQSMIIERVDSEPVRKEEDDE